MVITRAGSRARARLRVPPRAAPQGARAARARRPAWTRPTCSARWRSSARSSTSAPRASRTSRADHHYIDATALDLVRKPWEFDVHRDREHVRRHPVRPDRGAGRRHGHGAVGRHRRPPRPVPAVPRVGAGHRGAGQGEPDRDDPVGGDDARLARRAQRRRCARRRGAAPRARGRRASMASGRVRPFEFGGRDGTHAIAAAVASEL